MLVEVFPLLDAAVYNFFYRWHTKSTEKSNFNFVISIVGGSIYTQQVLICGFWAFIVALLKIYVLLHC